MTLDELRRLEREATKGPWIDVVDPIFKGEIRSAESGRLVMIELDDRPADTACIAALRNAAPVLLEVAEAAKAYKEACEQCLMMDGGTTDAEYDAIEARRQVATDALFAAVEKMEGMK